MSKKSHFFRCQIFSRTANQHKFSSLLPRTFIYFNLRSLELSFKLFQEVQFFLFIDKKVNNHKNVHKYCMVLRLQLKTDSPNFLLFLSIFFTLTMEQFAYHGKPILICTQVLHSELPNLGILRTNCYLFTFYL